MYKYINDSMTNLSKRWFLKPLLIVHGHIPPNIFEVNAEPISQVSFQNYFNAWSHKHIQVKTLKHDMFLKLEKEKEGKVSAITKS